MISLLLLSLSSFGITIMLSLRRSGAGFFFFFFLNDLQEWFLKHLVKIADKSLEPIFFLPGRF
jgi:hypothetical protein